MQRGVLGSVQLCIFPWYLLRIKAAAEYNLELEALISHHGVFTRRSQTISGCEISLVMYSQHFKAVKKTTSFSVWHTERGEAFFPFFSFVCTCRHTYSYT